MIRILLSLAIAAAGYFGALFADAEGTITGAMPGALLSGESFLSATAECLINQDFSIAGECAPKGGLMGQLLGVTVGLSLVSAVLGVIGLLPLVGRLTSIVTMAAGAVAVATFGYVAYELLTTEGATFTDIRWGAYALGGFGFLTVMAGLSGIGGDDR